MSYVVFSKALALQLRQQGFKILGSRPNEKNPQYDVYYFEDNEKLREEVKKFQTNKKQKEKQIWRKENFQTRKE